MARFNLVAEDDGFHTDGYFTAVNGVRRTWLDGDHVWFCEQGLREFFEIPDGVDRIAAIFTDKRPRGQDYYKLTSLSRFSYMVAAAPDGFTEDVSVSQSVIAAAEKHGPYLQILY